ncbi:MAG: tripartite tricarboxylate transporter TctB family protein [Clostridia bacterium]
MKIGERVFIIALAIFSFAIIAEAVEMPLDSEYTIGPGFVPFWIAIFMILTAIMLMVQTFERKKGQGDSKSGVASKITSMVTIQAFIKSGAFKRVITMLIIAVVAVWSMSYVGMLIPSFLFLIIAFRFIEEYKWFTSIRVSLATMVVLYLIFKVWLGVQIPDLFL